MEEVQEKLVRDIKEEVGKLYGAYKAIEDATKAGDYDRVYKIFIPATRESLDRLAELLISIRAHEICKRGGGIEHL